MSGPGNVRALVAACLLGVPLACAATDPAVHPAQGQSADAQARDEAQCHARAVDASGVDPAQAAAQATATPAPVTGSGARLKGAAAGAAVGAIADNDVGDAAAKGAVVGGVAQRRRNRAAAAQAQAKAQADADAFAAARRACLLERGYRVD